MPLTNCYFYSKVRADAVYTSKCLFGLSQHVATGTLFDILFTTFNPKNTLFNL